MIAGGVIMLLFIGTLAACGTMLQQARAIRRLQRDLDKMEAECDRLERQVERLRVKRTRARLTVPVGVIDFATERKKRGL